MELDLSGVRQLAVDGDRRLLVEAVDNLVSNAVKHAPESSTVTCVTAFEDRQAVIRIGDEGNGLTELDLQRAFRPFAASAARRRARPGSFGLGLWITRLIAERHGGGVQARSP